MPNELKIRVNERAWTIESPPDTPLLYVLMNDLNLQGPRFGCGLGQCGSCSVPVNGIETRSCRTPVSAVEGKSVTTLEGLPQWYAAQKKLSAAPQLHPVQQAMIDEQAVQCGMAPLISERFVPRRMRLAGSSRMNTMAGSTTGATWRRPSNWLWAQRRPNGREAPRSKSVR